MRSNKQSKGSLFVEFAVVLSLFIAVIFGMGQQLLKVLHDFDHYALATELAMGPQLSALAFDQPSGEVVELASATTPTLNDYMTTIGDFFRQRAPNTSYALYASIGHLNINSVEGTLDSVDDTTLLPHFTYSVSPAGGCVDSADQINNWLKRYTLGKLDHAVEFVTGHAPVDPTDDSYRFGSKLYDINEAGVRKRSYEVKFPILFVIICSEIQTFGLNQRDLTYHMIVPRRHLN